VKTTLSRLIPALALSALALTAGRAQASSHREAPAISNDPAADNTDVYAWVSPGFDSARRRVRVDITVALGGIAAWGIAESVAVAGLITIVEIGGYGAAFICAAASTLLGGLAFILGWAALAWAALRGA